MDSSSDEVNWNRPSSSTSIMTRSSKSASEISSTGAVQQVVNATNPIMHTDQCNGPISTARKNAAREQALDHCWKVYQTLLTKRKKSTASDDQQNSMAMDGSAKFTFYMMIKYSELFYSCKHCISVEFKTKLELIEHEMEYHSLFICSECHQYFHKLEDYKKHGDLALRCNICNHAFYDIQLLIAHLHDHAPITPYFCQICRHNITNKENFLEHLFYFHSNEKPFACINCKSIFISKKNFERHYFNCVKSTQCPYCNLQFFSELLLNIHLNDQHIPKFAQ